MRSAFPLSRLVLALTIFFGVCILLSLPLAAAPTSKQQPEISTTIVISEFRVRGPNGANDEFVEIYNLSFSPVNIGGWKINGSNNVGTTSTRVTITAGTTLNAGCHYLVTNSSASGGPYSGSVVGNQTYGTGITDDGGIAILLPDNTIVDQVGMNTGSAYKEGTPLTSLGNSNLNRGYERKPGGTSGSGTDIDDNSSDFQLVSPSDPQNLASTCISSATNTPTDTPTNTPTLTDTPTDTPTDLPTNTLTDTPTNTLTFTPTDTPTNTPTSTPTPTFTPLPSFNALDVVVNEVAWSGTTASANGEWIELYNNTNAAIDLAGWTLQAADGAPNISLSGTIPALGYYLLERTTDSVVSDIAADQIYTGALGNGGEQLRLRDPASNEIDSANGNGGAWPAGTSSPPCSMERNDPLSVDADANWATNDNVHRNGLDAANNPICGTPKNLNSTLAPTPTPTFTATPAPDGLFVNEFMPDPEQDWNGDSVANDDDEWIEIYNANAFSVNLSGWFLDDVQGGGSAPFALPSGTTINPNGYLVFYRADTNIALNNSNDDVRLLAPDSSTADAISYKSSVPNASWSRVPDGASYFSLYCPPTPNAPNCSIAPTPTMTPTPFAPKITINEFLPVPYQDWNKDGILDAGDEWIELYNGANHAVDLSGWKLDDGKNGSSPFKIPAGVSIAPRGFLVFYASDTTIGLNNQGDVLRLLHPDNSVADKQKYEPIETNKAYGRYPDGADDWVTHCLPTPGAPNCSRQPQPTPTRVFNLTTIAEARALPDESRVSVLGSVIAHPCELDTYGHEMSISDGAAGIDVYLDFPHQLSCLIPRDEQLVITGVIRDHFGLRTIYPNSNDDVTRHYRPPRAIAPLRVHTGDVNEAVESMLISIQGQVSNGKNGDTIWVNDGSGMVEVYADGDSHTSFEGITRGSIVRIVGIGYQNNRRKLPNEGYFIRVRAPDDVIVLELAEKLPNAPVAPGETRNRGGVDLGAVSISQALDTRTQNYVTIGGVVTVPPGVIGERDFWIQDAEGGAHISVASSAGDPPKMNAYDNVSVRGRVVSSFGAREIRVELPDAIGVHGAGNPVSPQTIQTGQADFSYEGMLVAIQGFVSSAQGREIYIDDGSGEVLVYIDANTRIRWPRLKRGDPARIVGVLTRFRGEPEILPRFQSDVQFGVVLLPIAGANDASFLNTLRVRGRVGEELKWTRHVQARADAKVARVSKRAAREKSITNQELAANAILASDLLTTASFLLLGASGVVGIIAVRKYRQARRRV